MTLANVHSIETFGSVDGPGLRYILFLKGCRLRCAFCHNADTWDLSSEDQRSADEILDHAERYRSYWGSEGGITVSGGEPLLQPHFLISLFKELKKRKIYTAIDTSGMVELTDTIKEVLSLTDLVLLDIKHIDSKKCKDLVGFENTRELKFAKYLSDNNIPIWIRQVLVPGYTDDENDLLKLKDFIKSLKSVERVEILPYHNLGEYKWKELNLEYALKDVRQANIDDVNRAKKILEIS